MLKILVFHFAVVYSQYSTDRRPTVQIKQGTITGIKLYGEDLKVVDAFLGIPYASPPINYLRFAPPKKHLGWNRTFEATEYASQCPQLPISNKYNEDCLRLNVWAPANAIKTGPKSVVIFIEGIEFQKSSGTPISGQDLAMEDVIVVSINYRLNVFGFLCLGIPEARGNLGLLDQYLGILWVKENIKYFGGDPEKITLFGYSAGAASVMLHVTSPRTLGLYQRIIISSGSPLSPWHISEDPFAPSKKLANILGCYNKDPKIVLKCLQSKSVYDILKSYENYVKMGNPLFLPIVDDFLPENDKYLLKSAEIALQHDTKQQVPIMVGISRKISDFQYNKWHDLSNQGILQLQQHIDHVEIPEIIRKYKLNTNNKVHIMELLKWRFISSSQSHLQLLLKQLKDLDFEAKIEAPLYSLLATLEMSHIGPLYVYYLSDLGIHLNTTNATITSDMLLLFGPLLFSQLGKRRLTNKEYRLSVQVKSAFKNFIIFGDPTPTHENEWKRYTSNDHYVETFQPNIFKQEDDIIDRNRRISFWLNLLPVISQRDQVITTSPKEFSGLDPTASFKHAIYTLVGLVIALLILLGICIIILKKKYKEEHRNFHMGY
nr:carboxylesterase 4A [Onthophagus taurus]